MRTRVYSLLAGALLVAVSAPTLAHHAFAAEFDASRPVTLEGVVTKWDWINPHAWISIDVMAEDGTISQWRIEGGAPNALLRRGWNKNSLPPGTEIVVEGFQAKDGAMRASGRGITFTDGRKLFLTSSGIGAPPGDSE